MGKVERGERDIGIDNIGKIAGALGVPASSLFLFGEDDYLSINPSAGGEGREA